MASERVTYRNLPAYGVDNRALNREVREFIQIDSNLIHTFIVTFKGASFDLTLKYAEIEVFQEVGDKLTPIGVYDANNTGAYRALLKRVNECNEEGIEGQDFIEVIGFDNCAISPDKLAMLKAET